MAYHLSDEVLEICDANFKLIQPGGGAKKMKGDCGDCPIKTECLSTAKDKKLPTSERNDILNELAAKLNKEK